MTLNELATLVTEIRSERTRNVTDESIVTFHIYSALISQRIHP